MAWHLWRCPTVLCIPKTARLGTSLQLPQGPHDRHAHRGAGEGLSSARRHNLTGGVAQRRRRMDPLECLGGGVERFLAAIGIESRHHASHGPRGSWARSVRPSRSRGPKERRTLPEHSVEWSGKFLLERDCRNCLHRGVAKCPGVLCIDVVSRLARLTLAEMIQRVSRPRYKTFQCHSLASARSGFETVRFRAVSGEPFSPCPGLQYFTQYCGDRAWPPWTTDR